MIAGKDIYSSDGQFRQVAVKVVIQLVLCTKQKLHSPVQSLAFQLHV
jgi:hypothetical protein